VVLRIQCPNCGTAYRLQDPLPPEGKRYRCKCSAVITVAYPPAVRERLRAQASDEPPSVSSDALRTGPVPHGAVPTAPVGLHSVRDEPAARRRPSPMLPPRHTGPVRGPMPGPSTDEESAETHRMGPSGALGGFAGFTAPPPMPPLDDSLRRDPAGGGPSLTAPVAPPSLEDTLRDRHGARVSPPPGPPPAPPHPSARPPAPPPSPSPASPGPAPRSPVARPVTAPTHGVPVPSREKRATTDPSRSPPAPPPRPQSSRSLPAVSDEALAARAARSQGPASARAEAESKKTGARRPPKAARAPKPPRARRPIWQWLLALVMLGVLVGAGLFAGVIWHYSQGLPSVQSLAVYEPPVGTIVTDEQGRFVGEFFKEQRYVVPFEEIPENLRNAFVSAEDAAFWEHSGLDYMGIARAMLKNLKQGRMAQGASTITQQVARSFLLTREKKLARKIREAILSYRVENSFSKDHILYLYLNQIYLGHGAYGVQAAARLYFDKDVQELSLAECGIIAGLPQSPSNYSPNVNFSAAKARQRYVLDQMARRGYVTQEEADAAYEQELVFSKKRDKNLDLAPFYVEHVRRYLFDRAAEAEELAKTDPEAAKLHPYTDHNPLRAALTVTIPIDLELQAVANQAIADGVRRADKRIGWRGSPKNLPKTDWAAEKLVIDRERTLALRAYHPEFELPKEGPVPADVLPALQEGEITRAVITEIDRSWALLDVGSRRALLPLSGFTWCHNVNPEVNFKFFKCRRFDDVLAVGDVVGVRIDKLDVSWSDTLPAGHPERSVALAQASMEQDPWPEASMMTMRTSDGAVLAMVGGTSFEGSEFNRAIQARRQVGSTFKPLVYAAALDSKDPEFTPSSILVDAPIVEAMSGVEGKLWKPGNSGDDYLGDTTFRRGLILSRNIVTLKICQAIGVKYALEYVQRFGFDSPLDPNLASCLGASAITLREMVRAYSTFATLGTRVEPRFITEVRDRHGELIERIDVETVPETLSPETAYMMVNLMEGVVTSGTARDALKLGVPVAGKTGTTNSYRDAWFMGYTPEIVTGVWVGLDEFKSMGRGQYGGEVALPVWMDVMAHALKTYPPSEYEKPENIKTVRVDSMTGKLAREGSAGVMVPFLKGTEPKEEAPAQGAVDAADFLSGEW
jgi:penicillin-binding protein 1A